MNRYNGVLNLNKPSGPTSHDMVYFVRRLFGEKKAGHAGTLDPLASGVLPILLGSATRLYDTLQGHDKRYRATLRLGISTDTMDITGNITKRAEGTALPGLSSVREAAAGFVGEISQLPPIYSAIKLKGKKLYEYARQGIKIEPKPRIVTIYKIECEAAKNAGEYILDVVCSKGTYIRSLCNDIGERLLCGATMAALERTCTGGFGIEGSYSPKYLEEYKSERGEEALECLLVSCEDVLKGIKGNNA